MISLLVTAPLFTKNDSINLKTGVCVIMADSSKVRIVWLKIMYSLTVVIAGALGVILLISPDSTQLIFNSTCPAVLSGMIGSLFLAFALVSCLGLRDPVKFIPLLLMQLLYKSVWLCFVALPLLVMNKIDSDIFPVIIVFLFIIVGDVIAIPFRQLLGVTSN